MISRLIAAWRNRHRHTWIAFGWSRPCIWCPVCNACRCGDGTTCEPSEPAREAWAKRQCAEQQEDPMPIRLADLQATFDNCTPNAIGRYRKRPIEIEAVQIDRLNNAALAALIDSATGVTRAYLHYDHNDDAISVEIETLEGTMTGRQGDWLIKGVKGELYPCRADIFVETYEPAETVRLVPINPNAPEMLVPLDDHGQADLDRATPAPDRTPSGEPIE